MDRKETATGAPASVEPSQKALRRDVDLELIHAEYDNIIHLAASIENGYTSATYALERALRYSAKSAARPYQQLHRIECHRILRRAPRKDRSRLPHGVVIRAPKGQANRPHGARLSMSIAQTMSNRDDFPRSIKRAVAMRAGWHCSFTGCQKPTVGPSEESSTAITMVGRAAHICGASSGSGSRRYDPSMTPEERKSIENAMWLCADHADLIDDDEVLYTVEKLRAMKQNHEAACAQGVRLGKGHDLGAGLLAVGSEVICTGDIQSISASTWTLRLKHFVVGDVHALVSFVDGFAKASHEDKYILSNEVGEGRVLVNAPTLTKLDDGYSLLCPIAPRFPRIDAQELGTDWALHSETGDLYLDGKRCIARVSGLEALPQRVQSVLSMQRGESPFNPGFGIRFFEYFEAYRGSPWLELLLKLDVIRQASIPYTDILKRQYTPLQCVTRVNAIELLSETPSSNHRLQVRVDFEVQGVGPWQRQLGIYMPTREQMDKQAALRASVSPLLVR